MSRMGEGGPGALQRAHALSAEASQMIQHPSPSLSSLTSALHACRQAAELFSAAAAAPEVDSATLKTLQLLTAQHRKLVRDVERRIGLVSAAVPSAQPNLRRAATIPAPSTGPSLAQQDHYHRHIPGKDRPTSPIKRPLEPAGLAAIGVLPSPFFASSSAAPRTNATSPSGVTRALPPFAQRPSAATPTSLISSTSIPQPSISPLYSSSSSSERDPAESYITFGLGLDQGTHRHHARELDPFSKFWGMLEECLDEVSRPLAFASAPMEAKKIEGVDETPQQRSERRAERARRKKENRSAREPDKDGTSSPSDSYCMITGNELSVPVPRSERNGSASVKTSEELILENESLRASLDDLAVHTQAVNDENQALKKMNQEREAVLKTVAAGVRKEAEKARLDSSVLLRSQVLSASIASETTRSKRTTHGPSALSTASETDGPGLAGKLKERIIVLEAEVKSLKIDNEKQTTAVARYKDRFDKIRASAKVKREGRETGTERDDQGKG